METPKLTRARRAAAAVAIAGATFALAVLRVDFVNDHFDRISRGRQILAYGEHPFADFRDPGYFLTLYVSAAAQAATGGSLLGEALVTSAALAAASALTFWLAASASGSAAVGLLAALLTWIEPPRYYDYDKVFFYTAGLALCWRYVASGPQPGALDGRDERTWALAAAACLTTLAALFRYDNGLYIFAACCVAILVRHRRSARARELAFYTGVVVAVAVPALVFVGFTAGVSDALRQVAEYATREGDRSELLGVPRLAFDRTSLLYVLVVMTPVLAAAELFLRPRDNVADAKLASAAALCACVCVFVLRDPPAARLGAAVPVAAVVGAAMIGRWRGDRRAGASSRRWVIGGTAAAALALTALVAAGSSRPDRLLRAPVTMTARLARIVATLRASPPDTSYMPDDAALGGLVEYLRTCTPDRARILVTWFAPEVFFFAERGFAGGLPVVLAPHWSSDGDQQRTIDQLQVQAAPLAIVQAASASEFRQTYRLLAAYLAEQYRPAGTTSFDDPRVGPEAYEVLIRRDLGDVPTNVRWRVACPREGGG